MKASLRARLRHALLVLALLHAGAARGQDTAYAAVLQRYAAGQHFSGTVLVAEAGRTLFAGTVGEADRAAHTPLHADAQFRIASVTKTFTAVLVLQLVEAGRLRLDAPLGRYLPEYAGPGKDAITIEHLLTYSSGLPDRERVSGDRPYERPLSPDRFMAAYYSGPLEAPPGTRFRYNNGDYILLGRIVERVTGRSFRQNLTERILKPLGMTATGIQEIGAARPPTVPTYHWDDSTGTATADKPYCLETFFAAGAMYASVADLLRFDRGIFGGTLLKRKTVAQMLTPHPKLDNAGLGFWVSGGYGAIPTPFVYRPGGIYGATANWIHVLAPDRTILVLSNTDAANLFALSQDLNAVADRDR